MNPVSEVITYSGNFHTGRQNIWIFKALESISPWRWKLLCSNWKCPTPQAVPRCHASQQTGIVTASLYVRLLLVIYTTRQRKIWAGAEGSLYRNPPRHGQVDCVWLGGPFTQASRHVFIWSRPPADYLIPGSTVYTTQLVAWNFRCTEAKGLFIHPMM